MQRFLLCLLLTAATADASTISGRVRMSRGSDRDLIPGARVTLSGPGLQTRVVTTDEFGRYRFLGVPPGARYKLVAKLEGLRSWPMTLEYLHSDDDAHADLPLDVTVPECELGRRWLIPAAAPPPGVFRVAISSRWPW